MDQLIFRVKQTRFEELCRLIDDEDACKSDFERSLL